MKWRGRRTWYRVVGALDGGGAQAPVVICHGGPGLTHDYLTSVAELSRSGRSYVLYDQFGGGRSEHRPEAPSQSWTVELFVEELQALIGYLGIEDAYHLLGHSWGGMLALEHAVTRPRGLRSIVVADAFASSAAYVAGVRSLLAELPEDARQSIERHEAAGALDAQEYRQAMRVFYGRHVCRARPVPEELTRTMARLAEDPTVYEAMMGPSEFTMTGSLRDWDITSRLDRVEAPGLVVSGRHDEVTPSAVEGLWRGLPRAEWVIFEESSHMPHLEEPDRFRDAVEKFLERAELA
ncbi:proline iminopeptidase-family hydrolase [Streptomyces sp. KR55]|uniref:proline iminopeptidase-family hydrolase n=1 Tax=Streptomyces sp. KR55 TaxID=3457425 RepID=UPI003FD11CAE